MEIIIRIYDRERLLEAKLQSGETCTIGKAAGCTIQLAAACLGKKTITVKTDADSWSVSGAGFRQEKLPYEKSLVLDPDAHLALTAYPCRTKAAVPVPLTGTERLTIGRNADCDIQIADQQISGKHTALFYQDGRWRFQDLNGESCARADCHAGRGSESLFTACLDERASTGVFEKTSRRRECGVIPLEQRAHLYTLAGVCALPRALSPHRELSPHSDMAALPRTGDATLPLRQLALSPLLCTCGKRTLCYASYSLSTSLVIALTEVIPIAIYHCNISIVSRGKGKSAVAAAAYRSGEKLTNEWDGMTHDYTRKGGVVHTEIMLPPHAPPSFADRSTLWNSVELYRDTPTSAAQPGTSGLM